MSLALLFHYLLLNMFWIIIKLVSLYSTIKNKKTFIMYSYRYVCCVLYIVFIVPNGILWLP